MNEEPPYKRSYKAGRRNDKRIPKQSRGRLSKNRWAWCKVYFGDIVIWADYIKNKDGSETDAIGDIKLVYPMPNRPTISWNLTALTVEELDAFKEIIDTAFELARPICKARDKEAADALAEGDDSHSRIYRAVPQLVYREGTVRQYRESLLNGSADASGVSQGPEDSSGMVRGPRITVAELDEAASLSEDDWSEADESEGVREMGKVGDGTVGVQGADTSSNPPAPIARPDVGPGEDAGGGS